jgi:hypothetical protein
MILLAAMLAEKWTLQEFSATMRSEEGAKITDELLHCEEQFQVPLKT